MTRSSVVQERAAVVQDLQDMRADPGHAAVEQAVVREVGTHPEVVAAVQGLREVEAHPEGAAVALHDQESGDHPEVAAVVQERRVAEVLSAAESREVALSPPLA